MKDSYTLEQAFLENNTSISHADMMNCLMTRTNAIINCLHVSLENSDNGMISELL